MRLIPRHAFRASLLLAHFLLFAAPPLGAAPEVFRARGAEAIEVARSQRGASPGLFRFAAARSAEFAAERDARLSAKSYVMRSEPIEVNLAAAIEMANGGRRAEPSPTLIVPMFDGAVIRADLTYLEIRSADSYSWAGKVPGEPFSSIVVTVHRGIMTGAIRSRAHGDAFIFPLPSGQQVLEARDYSRMPMCGGAVRSGEAPTFTAPDDAGRETPTELRGDDFVPSNPDHDSPIVDLLLIYTDDVLAEYGNAPTVEVILLSAAAQANDVFVTSTLPIRVNVTDVIELSYTEPHVPDQSLADVRGRNDGKLDFAHYVRSETRSDLVALIVEQLDDDFSDATGTGTQGIASLMSKEGMNDFRQIGFAPLAFSSNDIDALDNYVLTHEIGHNMGCGHEIGNGDRGAFTFSRGYVDFLFGFNTIMGYVTPLLTNRIGYFSSPEVSVGTIFGTQVPVGTAIEDNVRSLRTLYPIFCNFIAFNDDPYEPNHTVGAAYDIGWASGLTLTCRNFDPDHYAFVVPVGQPSILLVVEFDPVAAIETTLFNLTTFAESAVIDTIPGQRGYLFTGTPGDRYDLRVTGPNTGAAYSLTYYASAINTPPDAPVLTAPANAATNVPLFGNLSWTGSDPDGDALTYTVFLDEENPSPRTVLAQGLTATTTPYATQFGEVLKAGKTYFWKVEASDGRGGLTASAVNSFTTPPGVNMRVESVVATGVSFTASAASQDGVLGKPTPATLSYNSGTTLNVTVPATIGIDKQFDHWERDGSFLTNQTTTPNITFNSDTLLVAVYKSLGSNLIELRILSDNPSFGVPVTFTVPDVEGNQDGVTPFSRLYESGSIVGFEALTPIDSKRGFQIWTDPNFNTWPLAQQLAQWNAGRTWTVRYTTLPAGTYYVRSVNLSAVADGAPLEAVFEFSPNDFDSIGAITSPDTRRYEFGTEVSFFAPEIDGLEFVEWTIDGAPAGTDPRIDTTLDLRGGKLSIDLQAIYGTGVDFRVISRDSNGPATIAFTPAATSGATNAPTPFNVSFIQNAATMVELTAPASANGTTFVGWEEAGQLAETTQSIVRAADQTRNLVALYDDSAVFPRLTITARNLLGTSAGISFSANDLNGLGGDDTPVVRKFALNNTIQVTAEANVGQAEFLQWEENGSLPSTNNPLSVSLPSSRNLVAVYDANLMLAVSVTGTAENVTIGVSPLDSNSQGDGVNSFTREWRESTSVTLTAPASMGDAVFIRWSKGGRPISQAPMLVYPLAVNDALVAEFATPDTDALQAQ